MPTRRPGIRRFHSLPLAALWILGAVQARASETGSRPGRFESLARARVPFVENRGQLEERVAFSASTLFGAVSVTRDGRLIYSLRPACRSQKPGEGWPSSSRTLTETLVSGRPRPAPGARAATAVSSFVGNDPRRWRSDVPSYDEVRLGEVWPGISVSLRAHAANVEKLFEVRPGARVEKIRLRVDGARALTIGRGGELIVATAEGDVRFAPPMAYQEKKQGRQAIPVAYVLQASSYGFRLGQYDRARPVIIDPVLQSSYLGGSSADSINAIAVHPVSGEVFVAGDTFSTDFPSIPDLPRDGTARGVDAFVARFDPTLSTLLQSTYFGGSGGEEALGIAIHPVTGEVLVAGFTSSTDFPSTFFTGQPASGGADDGFVARFDPVLKLLRATYLGGNDFDTLVGIAVHPWSGQVYVAGYTTSRNLPAVPGGAQPALAGDADGFIARLDPALAHILQATYLGGTGTDSLRAIAIQPSTGEILAGGETTSGNDFPGADGGANAYPPGGNGNFDGFITRVDPTLTRVLQSSYIGGGQSDEVIGIAAHPLTGEILVTGWTSNDFPATAEGAQPSSLGRADCFVARFNPTLTELRQATFLGGSSDEICYGIAIHPSRGEVYVTGETFSTDLAETAGAAQPSYGGHDDGFIARLDSTLTRLIQTTYLGGSAEDAAYAVAVEPSSGDLLVAGTTLSDAFPGSEAGAEGGYAGGSVFGGDGFVSRLPAALRECNPVLDPLCPEAGRLPIRLSPRRRPR